MPLPGLCTKAGFQSISTLSLHTRKTGDDKMATSASNLNEYGLLVMPTCADPGWVQVHGTPQLE